MALKPFIGIKRIWYGAVIAEAVTKTSLPTIIAEMTEVKNSHQDTWGYSQDDPTYTDYINELNGEIYFRDVTQRGANTITFTMGEWEFSDKVALEGGELVDTDGWASTDSFDTIDKAVVAQTKTGNFIVFTNASIVAKNNQVEKNIGLGVTAVAMTNSNTGVKARYMFNGANITLS